MKELKKPVKPICPDISDKKKYPREEGKRFADKKTPFITDYRKYQKDLDKYSVDIVVWEQTKLIEAIKRTSIQTCLKKYTITKK